MIGFGPTRKSLGEKTGIFWQFTIFFPFLPVRSRKPSRLDVQNRVALTEIDLPEDIWTSRRPN
jgi:hypothetical protein